MNDPEHPTLVAVAEAVTDGMKVDWDGLKSRNPELTDDLATMEALSEVAQAYRALREGSDTPPSTSGPPSA